MLLRDTSPNAIERTLKVPILKFSGCTALVFGPDARLASLQSGALARMTNVFGNFASGNGGVARL